LAGATVGRNGTSIMDIFTVLEWQATFPSVLDVVHGIFSFVVVVVAQWELSSPYEHQFEPESICEIYFDKWIRFLYKLFRKWKELEVRIGR
jgi:hypothetical protein